MVIRSKDFVPYFYRNSRDYQSILALFDLIINVTKINIDTLIDNLDPNKCNYLLLELLASFVGYDYDHKESYDANRLIINNYINMIRNRGNVVGLKTAAALSFNAKDDEDRVEQLDMFSVRYLKDERKIAIYIYVPTYLNKIRDLIERVRPAGIPLELIPAYNLKVNETLEVHDYFDPKQEPYNVTRRSVGQYYEYDEDGNIKLDKNGNPIILGGIGHSEVTREGEPHQ